MFRITGKLLIGIMIISLVAVMAGCGDDTSTTTSSDTKARNTSTSKSGSVSATTGSGATKEISISGFKFLPADLTIPVGTTVKWTNEDSVPHTATADDKSFDSSNMNQGDSFEFTFSEKGSFPYICTYHPQMVGTITVE